MWNPYFSYSFSFIIAIAVYSLGWSTLYPGLSPKLLLFVIVTAIAFLFQGIFLKRQQKPFSSSYIKSASLAIIVTIVIYVLWIVEFIHAGGVPLIKILLNQPYDYRLFGIKTLHVIVVTFSSFFTLLLFQSALFGKRKIFIILYLANLAAGLLIFNRAMFIFNICGSFFIFLFSLKTIPKKAFILLPIFCLFLLFAFGVLGTLRVSREAKTPYHNRHFLSIGAASDPFRESLIPKEYFWAYIYVSSPLANFQENINKSPHPQLTLGNLGRMINNEILPDFISKRINAALRLSPKDDYRIEGPFNVSTIYSRCYSYSGWPGVIIMAILLFALPLLYNQTVEASSPFYLAGLAILSTIYLFAAFDNTIRFTGLSFQIVYPILLHFITKRSLRLAATFVNNKVTKEPAKKTLI